MSQFSIPVIVQFISTIALFGLIWVIQLVHYPAFAFVSASNGGAFSAFHSNSISLIVAPLMLAELASAFWLISESGVSNPLSWLNLVTILALWFITFFVFVPLHAQLSVTFSPELIQSLVQKNWWRTILWTMRVPLLFWMLWHYKP